MISFTIHLFLSFFEILFITLTAFHLMGINFKPNLIKLAIYSLIISIITFIFNSLEISMWLKSVTSMVVGIIYFTKFLGIRPRKSILLFILIFVMIGIIETMMFLIINLIWGLKFEDLLQDDFLKLIYSIAYNLVNLTLLMLATITGIKLPLEGDLINLKSNTTKIDYFDFLILLLFLAGLILALNLNFIFYSDFQNNKNLIVIVLLLGVILVYCMMALKHYTNSMRVKTLKIAERTYLHNIEELFMAMKTQQSGFNNDIQVILGLWYQNQTTDMENYLKKLSGEMKDTNVFFCYGNTALSALLKSKTAFLKSKHIQLSITVHNNIKNLSMETFDLVRMVGIIIDTLAQEILMNNSTKVNNNIIELEMINELGSFIISIFIKGFNPKRNSLFNSKSYFWEEPLDDAYVVGYLLKKYKGTLIEKKEQDNFSVNIQIPNKGSDDIDRASSKSFSYSFGKYLQ